VHPANGLTPEAWTGGVDEYGTADAPLTATTVRRAIVTKVSKR
jgi:hypothetical protein